MKTIILVNQKGGTLKTSATVTLGHGLARQGRRVLICDLDAQGNCADSLGIAKTGGLYKLLIDEAGAEAVTPSGRDNLDVITSDKTTVQVKQILTGRPFREQVLANALGELAGGYDVALVDCAPSVDLLQISALLAGDGFLVPAALDFLAGVGVNDVLTTAATVQAYSDQAAEFMGPIPVLWERVTRESHEQLKMLAEQFRALVWPPIPRDVKAREAPAFGQTLWEYAPQCRALIGVEINGGRVGGYQAVLDRLEAWL